jgi:ribosomal protein L7/L12
MVPGLGLKEAKTAVDEYIDGDRSLGDIIENLGNDGLREKLRERGLSLAVVHHK